MEQASQGTLSAREQEIVELVATGATNQQIARELTISVNTVKAHLRNIFAKLEVESRTEATLYAIQHGLIQVVQPSGGDGALATQRDGADVEERPGVLMLRRMGWPMGVTQRAIILCSLALVLIVIVWPRQRVVSSTKENRLLDMQVSAGEDIQVAKNSRWQARAQMPTPRGRFAQADLENMIYVIAGLTDEGWTARVERYDVLEDLWQRRASKPTAVANVGAVALDGRIYVPGGLDETNTVRDILEVYDPAGDIWTTAASLPMPICAYAIAAFEDGFYLFGGWDGREYLNSVYYYDVSSDSWRKEVPLRTARGFASAARVQDRLYIVGGYDGTSEYRLCESYDPALAARKLDPWLTHSPMNAGRAGHSMAFLQGSLYVVGGGWESPLKYNERYDIANDAWSTFESPISGEWRTLGLSAIDSEKGACLYAIGGWSGRYLSTVKAYQTFFRVFLP